jgi:hypothetical protein
MAPEKMNTQKEQIAATKRAWNWRIWAGFVVAVAAFASYILIFYRYPITRNVPWANWLLFALACWLLWGGLRRAWQKPEIYGGKISGSIAAVLSLALAGFFAYGTLLATRGLPPSAGAPRVGARAPEFVLADTGGKMVALSSLLSEPMPGGEGSGAKPLGVVLIFYRGYW